MDKLAWCDRCVDSDLIRCETTDYGREVICYVSGQVLAKIEQSIEDCPERWRKATTFEKMYNIYLGEKNR